MCEDKGDGVKGGESSRTWEDCECVGYWGYEEPFAVVFVQACCGALPVFDAFTLDLWADEQSSDVILFITLALGFLFLKSRDLRSRVPGHCKIRQKSTDLTSNDQQTIVCVGANATTLLALSVRLLDMWESQDSH